MSEANVANFKAALKTLYPTGIEKAYYQNHPLAAMIPRKTDFVGEDKAVTVNYATTQGRSHTFSKAQGNKKSSSLAKFRIERRPDYSLASLSNELILASESNAGAIIPALKLEMDNAYEAAVQSEARSLYGSGTGKRGQVKTISTNEIELVNPRDIVFIEVGMAIEVSVANGGGAVRAGQAIVDKVNRRTGKFTVVSAAAITGLAVGDYIFAAGDYDLGLSGLAAWVPAADPTSGESFWGVDRTKDSERLAGIRFDGSALPIEEAGLAGGTMLTDSGSNPDYWFMNPYDHENLVKSQGSKVQFVDVKSNFDVNFRGVQMAIGNSIVKAVADRNCPKGDSWMVQMNTLCLQSLGPSIRNLDLDGLKMLREGDADNVEFRIGGYKQMEVTKPGFNAYIKIG